MNKEEVKEAIITGYKASSVLNSLILELIDDTCCLNSYGFEGAETYPDCGHCVVCVSRKIAEEVDLNKITEWCTEGHHQRFCYGGKMCAQCKPYRVRIYLWGIFKRGGAVVNIPEVAVKRNWIKNYLRTKINGLWKYRIKITPYEG